MSAGYTPQWISLLDAIEHVRSVFGGTIEEAWNALVIPLREGAILGRFRGQAVGGIAAAIEGDGAVPSGWWYNATVARDGSVGFADLSVAGRRLRREIEIQRSDLLKHWPDQAADKIAESAPAKRRKRGPVPGMIDRYGAADRALYGDLERIVQHDKLSVAAAAARLADEGKIAGIGNARSRATRLAERYRRDRKTDCHSR
jgi:hypothetical protein